MTKLANVLSGVVLLGAGIGIGFGGKRLHDAWFGSGGAPAPAEPGKDEEVEPADMEVGVRLALAREGSLARSHAVVGTVRADPLVLRGLSTRAHGRIQDVAVRPGETVAKDQVLAHFDPVPRRYEVEQARAKRDQARSRVEAFDKSGRRIRTLELEAAVEKAAAERRLAATAVKRLSELKVDGLVAQKALDEARHAEDQAAREEAAASRILEDYVAAGSVAERAALAFEVAGAEAALADSEAVLAATEIRAPEAGVVIAWTFHAGESAEAGANLGTLRTGDDRILVFAVAPAEVADIRVGGEVRFVDGAGEHRKGAVIGIAGDGAAADGLVEVVVAPSGEAGTLPLGLVVRGSIVLPDATFGVVVPEAAVTRHEDKTVVVVVDSKDAAHRIDVKVVHRLAGEVLVLGEVHAGDRVVIDGGYNLPDGAHVVPKTGDDAPEPKDAKDEGHVEPGGEKR